MYLKSGDWTLYYETCVELAHRYTCVFFLSVETGAAVAQTNSATHSQFD